MPLRIIRNRQQMSMTGVKKNVRPGEDKIRIAFVIDYMGSVLGGTEKQLLEIINRLDRKRFEPVLLTLAGSPSQLRTCWPCATVELGYQGFLSLKLVPSLVRFRRILRKMNFHVVQTFFEDSTLFTYIATRRFPEAPRLVCSRRDVGMGIEVPWYHALFDFLRPFVLLRFDWVAVNSQAVKDYVMAKDRITESRIVNIPNGVALAGRNGPKPAGLQDREVEFRIGMVANIKPIKRIDVFINAIKLLSLRLKDLRFRALLIGNAEGAEGEMWKQTVANLDLASRVIFTGPVRNVGDYLRCLDVGVLCSDKEGSSNAVLEYMASRLPVIATDIPGNAELVRNNENGILFPPGDAQALANALVRLASDRELREKMGKTSRAIAEQRHSWDVCIRNWESFYREAVSKRPVRMVSEA